MQLLYNMAYTELAEFAKTNYTIKSQKSPAYWAYTLTCFFKEIVHLIKLCSA
jgi:hypothetical protein